MVFLEEESNQLAEELRKALLIPGGQQPDVAVILGTGWGDLLKIENEVSIPFKDLGAFAHLQALDGHKRQVCYGQVGGKRVIALRGRVHLNERPYHEETALAVRLQVQMLVALGVKDFIITNAAGALGDKCRVGDVVVVDGFVSLFAPDLPLAAGEFCSPDDMLHPVLREIAVKAAEKHIGESEDHYRRVRQGGYAMMRGPFFEGRRYDKQTLRLTGASGVGMSSLPETAVIGALQKEARVLVLSYITNSDKEQHSHEENVRRAKLDAPQLGAMLTDIIGQL